MNRNINKKNNMIKNDEWHTYKVSKYWRSYYLQTRMLSNVDNAEKIISRNSI